MTLPIEDQSNADVIANAADWCEAVNNLLPHWMEHNRSFSSGEVAAALRTHRPDFRFSVLTVGGFLRDQFYAGTMPQYPDDGMNGPQAPTQVSRMTEGKYPDRTPANVEVFVYCPTSDDGYAHDFEVFIPKPGESMDDAPAPKPTTPKTRAQIVSILGAKVAVSDLRAKVTSDKRLYVPRSAFELAVHLGGQPMKGGDPVYVKVTDDTAVIFLTDPNDPEAKVYDLSLTRGRVKFPSADPACPFVPDTTYKIEVDNGVITIDLTNPL